MACQRTHAACLRRYDEHSHERFAPGDPTKRAFTYFVLTGGRFIYASALRLAVLKFILSMTVCSFWAMLTEHALDGTATVGHRALTFTFVVRCVVCYGESQKSMQVKHPAITRACSHTCARHGRCRLARCTSPQKKRHQRWVLRGCAQATKDVLAMASLEVDLNKIEPGQTITVKWRGKPVFIKRRTPEDIELANAVPLKELRDPQTDAERTQNPEVCG